MSQSYLVALHTSIAQSPILLNRSWLGLLGLFAPSSDLVGFRAEWDKQDKQIQTDTKVCMIVNIVSSSHRISQGEVANQADDVLNFGQSPSTCLVQPRSFLWSLQHSLRSGFSRDVILTCSSGLQPKPLGHSDLLQRVVVWACVQPVPWLSVLAIWICIVYVSIPIREDMPVSPVAFSSCWRDAVWGASCLRSFMSICGKVVFSLRTIFKLYEWKWRQDGITVSWNSWIAEKIVTAGDFASSGSGHIISSPRSAGIFVDTWERAWDAWRNWRDCLHRAGWKLFYANNLHPICFNEFQWFAWLTEHLDVTCRTGRPCQGYQWRMRCL